MAKAETLNKFLEKELPALPRRITRKQYADFVSAKLFQVSPLTTRRWPLTTRYINGRTTLDTREALIVAWKIFSNDDPGRSPHYREKLAEGVEGDAA
jgi:hypothetical protein